MDHINVSSVDEFLRLAVEPNYVSNFNYYRGVSDVNKHKLIPSIGRHKDVLTAWSKSNATNQDADKLLMSIEDRLLTDFKLKSLPFLTHSPESDIEWMCLAQHYGIHTRLLDWTGNALVALFFAAKELDQNCDFGVYAGSGGQVSDIEHLENMTRDDLVKRDIGFFFTPPHRDVRYINQKGMFSFHPDPMTEWDSRGLKLYMFPAGKREEIYNSLFKLGITNSFIFPSLDMLAADILYSKFTSLNLERYMKG